MKVKLLEIEAVTNGWIVRPSYQHPRVCDYAIERPMWVFTNISDLQVQLPRMLDYDFSTTITTTNNT